jgi:membrane glycosyltransferase
MNTNETISDVPRAGLAATAPKLLRGSMTPLPWRGLGGALRARFAALLGRGAPAPRPAPAARWTSVAADRRRLLLALVVGSAALATLVLESAAPAGESSPWAGAQTALFAVLFAWVSAGCVTAVMGYLSLLRGDRHALTAAGVAHHPIDPAARTAIIMPICNEDIATVAAGLRATCESLIAAREQAGAPPVFDVYLLSDTSDPKLREAELVAWQVLRERLGDLPVYYRWRQRRTKKKAGNVADFCRRWGRQYRYMVVLDADSVMSGDALLTMVRLMEAHPRAGIVQTAPRSCGHDSLHARIQQFAGRVSGALFSAGLRYWQLGESHYWGHNAILRVEPFMKHCALAPLAGRGGLSGPILSHDFVEAALMRRAGYEVWLVPDIEGSYEQPPPHLIDELQRDRRWCQGNLQNARLIAEPGLAGVHRAMFITGAMSYVASPLWLGFAVLGVLPWLVAGPAGDTGLPLAAVGLWTATLALLFLPRVLAVRLIIKRGEAAAYGGARKLAVSAALEALLSALQAPVRMVAHSIFVLGALTGLKLAWKSPSREATDVGWREAAARFGLVGVLVAAALAWWLAGQPADAWRVLPMALPLVLAVPLAVVTSRTRLGKAWRRRGWLLIPEESNPPAVLQAAWGTMPEPGSATAGRELPASATAPVPQAAAVVPAARPARRRAPLPSNRGAGVLAWPGRGLAFASIAMASAVAMLVPNTVATGGLSASDLAAMRIVMMASSPSAAPRVLDEARPSRALRRVAVSGNATPRAKSRPTSI